MSDLIGSPVSPVNRELFEAAESVLLDGGADQRVRDSRHDSDALGWAEFFGQQQIVEILKSRGSE